MTLNVAFICNPDAETILEAWLHAQIYKASREKNGVWTGDAIRLYFLKSGTREIALKAIQDVLSGTPKLETMRCDFEDVPPFFARYDEVYDFAKVYVLGRTEKQVTLNGFGRLFE